MALATSYVTITNCPGNEFMTYRPEPHETGERSRLLMRRFVSRFIWRNPDVAQKARNQLITFQDHPHYPHVYSEDWHAFWDEALTLPTKELCRLVGARGHQQNEPLRSNPIALLYLREIIQNEEWRRKTSRKAKIGIVSLHESLERGGDKRALNQFFWSEINDALAHQFDRKREQGFQQTSMPNR
jgi:hypothetical protein